MRNNANIEFEFQLSKIRYVYLRTFLSNSKHIAERKSCASLFYVLSGEIECIKNGTKTILKTNDYFFWDYGDYQVVNNRNNEDCHVYVIGYEFNPITSLHTNFNIPSYGTLDNSYFQNLCSKIHQAWNERRKGYIVKIYSLFYNIIYNILTLSEQTDDTAANHYKLQQTVQYIYTNIFLNIKIEDLCKISGYSKAHLNRMFIDMYQMSPKKFINNAKINRAKIILENTNNPVSDIASQLGYEDVGYFCRVFKRITSYTPLEYKNLYFSERI